QIYAYILIVQNLRLGGLWGSGTKTSQNVTGAIERDAELKTGYGGLTADYVFPVTQRLDFTVGTLLGGGSVNLKLTKTTGSPVTWDSTWADFGSPGPTQSYTRNLTGAFFVFQPNVSAEYAVLRWLGLRVGVGYNETIATNWREDDNYDIVGVPDNVSGRGFMINAGLFVGTFIF
ncbi:MAG TPA: hypothetical protein VKS81_11205, partial [Bacteroidota bacterium]|nr:hypothetical protein [Bacteroidota bacterium]